MPDDAIKNTSGKPSSQKPSSEPLSFDTREELFKSRFVAVITDMGTNVRKDPETMFFLGSLAGRLVTEGKKTSWAKTKAALSPAAYDSLLNSFQDKANQLAAKGNAKAAYAVEILALSLIAPTMRADEHIASGNELLDNMIEDTIRFYRQRTNMKSN